MEARALATTAPVADLVLRRCQGPEQQRHDPRHVIAVDEQQAGAQARAPRTR
ncbi:hypothetical protein IMZ11_11750 [Microtetraspora sp. AC03309]|uniref:hypothetical protein n=1 Tax=Microtetraspora sp. AC03309 TaxID=2779376 RepID=UPI001E5D5E2D|nr:hypothetical protein [Microtetraspora sp. AC03309]MCC5576305.1 hypothetical protein [Microtetraspora sp. AC03309]